MATETESKETTKQVVCEPAIMQAPQMSSWNDNRLGRFEHRMDEGFKEMREGFARIESAMKAGFDQVPTRDEMNQRLIAVDKRFSAVDQRLNDLSRWLQRLAMIGGGALVTLLGNGIFG
jgi:hypothetical protein